MEAGLGEITFSLHGHTPELHDRLTRHKGSFKRLIKGMVRAVRDPKGPIVNVDVVINKQNVPYLDQIISLCSSLGVFEFDLLHVIPQSEAFRNRDMLFYDILEHKDMLHKVFRLNRHPRFVIWTNRFPISYLEGLEDLIQDPHKMLDEVHGRRFQVRRYIDTGEALDCRQPERCVHCFIEPFCTTMERAIDQQNKRELDVWYGALPLAFGATRQGVRIDGIKDLPTGDHPLEVFTENDISIEGVAARDVRWIASRASQLEQWTGQLSSNHQLEILLNKDTEPWLLRNRAILRAHKDQISLAQPSYETMREAVENDIVDVAEFLKVLSVDISCQGLPMCVVGDNPWKARPRRLSEELFTKGRLTVSKLAAHHIKEEYRGKSARCRECVYVEQCDGLHINQIRSWGLKALKPLKLLSQPAPPKQLRIKDGLPNQPVAPSLAGYAPPSNPAIDPLVVLGEEAKARKAAKRMARMEAIRKE